MLFSVGALKVSSWYCGVSPFKGVTNSTVKLQKAQVTSVIFYGCICDIEGEFVALRCVSIHRCHDLKE